MKPLSPRNSVLGFSALCAGFLAASVASCSKQRSDEPGAADPSAATARATESTTQAASERTAPNADSQKHAPGASFDQRFIDMMTPHHEAGVEAARLAEQRASRAELKKMASEMIAKQTKEVGQLKTWRSQWFGSADTPPTTAMPMLSEHGTAPTHDMSQQIAHLRNAENFDKAFVDHMLEHHGQAIEAARAAEQKAEHAELKRFATKLASDQDAERKQLERWRTEWFQK